MEKKPKVAFCASSEFAIRQASKNFLAKASRLFDKPACHTSFDVLIQLDSDGIFVIIAIVP